MTLQQARYLMVIVQEGSIGRAAKKLYVAQSSLSTTIKEVEKEYGLTIFRRSSRGVELTHEGREFAVDLQQMLDCFEYVDAKYHNRVSDDRRFCVASQHHICGEGAFIRLLSSVSRDSFRFGWLECKTSEVMTNVEHGTSDVGFLFYDTNVKSVMIQELRRRELMFNHIAWDRPHIYVSGHHPLAGKKEVAASEVRDLPFISYDTAGAGTSIYTSILRHTWRGRRNFYVSDRATACSLLRATDAFLIGAGYLPDDPGSVDIVSIPIVDAGMIEIGWICHQKRSFSETAEKFIELVREMYC